MKKSKKQMCPNCGKEMVLAESHERECDQTALEYSYQCTFCGYQVNVIEPTEEEEKSHSKIFGTMKRRLVFYPTLFKDIVVHPPTRSKVGTLTAFYSHGVGGFDLRPFVLEILER